jgi:23S rRNA pseudouridine2457 synthase
MLIALNKPYGVHCKFTDAEGRPTLAQFGLPPGVYAAGRLDHDSEGLVLLTDDGRLNHKLTAPRLQTRRTYLAQVEGTITEEALEKLRYGLVLKDGPTLRAEATAIPAPDWLWPRDPPIRFRKTVPDGWIQLVLREGRNRQVRRMTAAVGLPTLRLVRIAHGPYHLDALAPGTWRQI